MNPASIIQMPGYRYADYSLILNPHEELRNKINHVKNEFANKYKSAYTGGRPYISLVKFTVWEMMEEKIINSLKPAAMAMPPFKITLKDYGAFPTHTLFINVESKVAIRAMVKELQSSKRLMRSPDHNPYFITEPYIPIASRIPAEIYEPAWLEYSHRQFTGSFVADAMLLLKRRVGEKGHQIIQRFEFMNQPVSIKQGELF